jgi:hypothetical protein
MRQRIPRPEDAAKCGHVGDPGEHLQHRADAHPARVPCAKRDRRLAKPGTPVISTTAATTIVGSQSKCRRSRESSTSGAGASSAGETAVATPLLTGDSRRPEPLGAYTPRIKAGREQQLAGGLDETVRAAHESDPQRHRVSRVCDQPPVDAPGVTRPAAWRAARKRKSHVGVELVAIDDVLGRAHRIHEAHRQGRHRAPAVA